jgi:trans-aconitate methyltransferase
MPAARFGEQRLVRPEFGGAQKLFYRLMGVPDPAHYLHFLYFKRGLAELGRDPTNILDAGCGRGDYSLYLARRFPAARVLGIDIDEQRIARNQDTARRMGLTNVRFEIGDLVRQRWDDPFDFVFSVDVLEHIVEQEAAIANLMRSMRPGGVGFFHIPTVREKPVPFSSRLQEFHDWAEEEHVAEERTAEQFVEVVRRAGFQVAWWKRTFGWFTGELATSLYALPYENTPVNRVFQALLAPVCRVLVLADALGLDSPRYAVAVAARKPAS